MKWGTIYISFEINKFGENKTEITVKVKQQFKLKKRLEST